MFYTIDKNTSAEITEKKSKFIANIFYVETVEEAEERIKEIKTLHRDARHNCFAFSIYNDGNIINRFSDDGEPSGTAGSPMLNIINSKTITNILVVVTRYFGGILLGTGGLVRAYTGAFSEALNNITIVKKDLGKRISILVTYNDLEKLKYYLNKKEIQIVDLEYGENVKVIVDITDEKLDVLNNSINDLNFNIIEKEIIESRYINIEE